MNLEPILLPEIIEFLEKEPRIWNTDDNFSWVTAELARSRGLNVYNSGYDFVHSENGDIIIDERYCVFGRFPFNLPFDRKSVSGRVLADFLKTLLTKEEIDE